MTGEEDWQSRGGTVSAGMVLAPMDMNIEHVFELTAVKFKANMQTPFGIKNKIETIWTESDKSKETAHRVWMTFNESYAEKSGLVGFIGRASPKPIMPGLPIKLGDYLVLGMKIRVLVQARIDPKTGLPNGYYDFIPASIKPVGTQSTIQNAPASATSVVEIGFICKGAQNSMDAYQRLTDACVKPELIALFVSEDKKGAFKYPL
jgi:hypothetical protein